MTISAEGFLGLTIAGAVAITLMAGIGLLALLSLAVWEQVIERTVTTFGVKREILAFMIERWKRRRGEA